MWRMFLMKGGRHLTLCDYRSGMITLFDDEGKSIRVTEDELYDLFRNHLDKRIADKSN